MPSPVPAPDEAASAALISRAGQWARRIAELLAERCTAEPKADEAVTFLRNWADALEPPHRAAGPGAEPLALLGERY